MIQITKVTNLGNDVIEVRGFDDSNPTVELVANGWVSAMTNYFPPVMYKPDGHLVDNAVSRSMSNEECQMYWMQLLADLITVQVQQPVLFQNPNAQAKLEQAKANEKVAEVISQEFTSGNIVEEPPVEPTVEPTQQTT